MRNTRGFTLIEILTVLGALAVLGGILYTLIKPPELFRCMRDSQRIKDLSTLNSIITHYINQTQNPDLDGPFTSTAVDESSSTIYISVPIDSENYPTSTVINGKTWYIKGVNRGNLRKLDSNGWLPINLSILKNLPIDELPIDPVNSFSQKLFYSYVFHRKTNGFELNANLECKKFQRGGAEDKVSTDGGDAPDIFETGSMLNLLPSEIYGATKITGIEPKIGLSDFSITINTLVNNSSSTKLRIFNLGSTTLAVYNIINTNRAGRILVDKNYLSIPIRSFDDLTITCNGIGIYSSTTVTTTLELWNNDTSQNPARVDVTCNIQEYPRIVVSPKEISIRTKIGSSASSSFVIYNKGASDLYIQNIYFYLEDSTSSCKNFVTTTQPSATISPGSSSTVTVTVDATSLTSKDNFYCRYIIQSNDVYRQYTTVKVNISVSANPRSIPNLTVTRAGSQKLKLTFNYPNDDGGSRVLFYKIYRKINADPTTNDFIASTTDTTFIDTGLNNGTKYCYRVSAVNIVGESNLSNSACEIPLATPTPPNLTATAGNKKIDLSWTVSDNGGDPLLMFDIFGKTSNESIWRKLNENYTSTSISYTNLTPCTNYQFYVIAKNKAGSSDPSNIASSTPYSTSTPPRNASTTAGVNSITLSWQPPENTGCASLIQYNIYKATSTPSNFVFIASTSPSTLSYTDNNVASGTTYYYYITAINIYGESDPSNVISGTPGTQKCTPPSNLSLTPGDRKITLNWNPSPSLNTGDYYYLYFSTTSSNFSKFATVTHPTTNYTHTGLTNGQVYYYYVTAEGTGCTESNPSNIASSTPGTVPSPPKNFKADSYQDKITLKWEAPESDGGFPILYYSLYRDNGDNVFSLLATTSASTLSYVDTNINPSNSYTYAISATNKIGEGDKAYTTGGYCSSWSEVLYLGQYGTNFIYLSSISFIYLLKNGKYLIVGQANRDGFLMRIDSLGKVEFLKMYGTDRNDWITSAVELDDGNYLVIGVIDNTYWNTSYDIFLAKISSIDGSVIWSKIFRKMGGQYYPYITRGVGYDNNVYITFGDLSDTFGSEDIVVMKLDQDGNIIWQKRYGGRGFDSPTKIVFYPRPTYYYKDYLFVIGNTGNLGGTDWLLLKLNTNDGSLVYAKTYEGLGIDVLSDIHPTYNDGIYLFGTTGYYPSDYMVLNVDDNPNLLSIYTGIAVEVSKENYGSKFKYFGSGHLLIGYELGLGAGSTDLLILKTLSMSGGTATFSKAVILGSQNAEREPVIVEQPTSTVQFSLNKILIGANIYGGIWLIKLDSNLGIKNSLNQIGFEPGSGFYYYDYNPNSIKVYDIRNRITAKIITNNLGVTNTNYQMENLSLSTNPVGLNIKYVAYCFSNPATSTPSEPRNLKAINQNTYNQLTWDPPLNDGGSPILYYKIYKFTTNWPLPLFLATTSNLSFNDTSIIPNTTYCYKVSAVNSVGEGPMSNGACATPSSGGGSVPSAPTLTVTPGNRANTLNWTTPNDGGSSILYYKVYLKSDGVYNLLATTSPSTLTYTHSNLTPKVQYCYKVSAVNSVGEGPMSNEACGTPYSSPSPPQNLRITVKNRAFDLYWDPPLDNGGSAITEYRIYRKEQGGSYTNTPLATTAASVLNYSDSNVIVGRTYCYVVTAKNNGGESGYSNEVCKKAGSVPGSYSIRISNYGKNFVSMEFYCITGALEPVCTGGYPILYYKLYRSTDNVTYTLIATTSRSNYTDNNVSSGITYYYKVSAVNEIGEGPTSLPVSVTPQEQTVSYKGYVAWGGVSITTGPNSVATYDENFAYILDFTNPTYISRIEMYLDLVNVGMLNVYCDKAPEIASLWINSSGTTTININRTCQKIYLISKNIVFYLGLPLDLSKICSYRGSFGGINYGVYGCSATNFDNWNFLHLDLYNNIFFNSRNLKVYK